LGGLEMNKIIRKKNQDYTILSNVFLKDKELSIKAKGFLAVVMGLPENWDFSINGICAILKEGKTAIYNVIDELKTQNYCNVKVCRDEKGRIIGNDYTFYEEPYIEKPHSEEPRPENPNMDNQPQSNTYLSNDEILINDENKNKEDKSSLKKGARKQIDSEWRKDYEAYKQLVLSAKDQLLNDQQAKQNILFMYPNADYYRTILKSVEFWCSEKGWEYKKKSTAKDINMLSTLKNNLNKNIVYRNVNDQPIENLQKLNISVNEQGICADGTFIRGAYRYYHSMRDNKDYSIPIQALPMPNERCEFNMKTQSWYLPYENENTDDLLW
jgi:hypothetical protein